MEELYQIGYITNTHGIRGEVKVIPTTDDPKRFEILDSITLYSSDNKIIELEIEKVRYFKQFVLLKLSGIESINDAQLLKKSRIMIPRSLLLPLEQDEYYISDLIGLKVITETQEYIGIIKDVLFTGSNDVYIIERENQKELLLPAIKNCIQNIDIDKGIITVHLMKGLIE